MLESDKSYGKKCRTGKGGWEKQAVRGCGGQGKNFGFYLQWGEQL